MICSYGTSTFWKCSLGALAWLGLMTSGWSKDAGETRVGQNQDAPGLHVHDGRLTRDGRPYQGMGINYFDLLIKMTGAEGKTPVATTESLRNRLSLLRQYQIPFVRFNAGGFYPVDWKMYMEDRERYFSIFDHLVREAEQQGIGLIPSLCFVFFTIPDLVHEPLDQWGNPQSRTIAFMREYVGEVVGRYVDSPAIWGWEFGNEYLLEADLPGVSSKGGQGWIEPQLGTPENRGQRDGMKRRDIRKAYVEFARTVRSIDPHRVLFTGDAEPRSAAWHNFMESNWEHDTPEQWRQVLVGDNPDPIDSITIHYYPFDASGKQHYGVAGMTPLERLEYCQKISREAGKPLFVGEFGPQGDCTDAELRRNQFFSIYDAIIQTGVPLSAFWVFDLDNQPENSVHAGKDLYILEAIQRANQQWNAGMADDGNAR